MKWKVIDKWTGARAVNGGCDIKRGGWVDSGRTPAFLRDPGLFWWIFCAFRRSRRRVNPCTASSQNRVVLPSSEVKLVRTPK